MDLAEIAAGAVSRAIGAYGSVRIVSQAQLLVLRDLVLEMTVAFARPLIRFPSTCGFGHRWSFAMNSTLDLVDSKVTLPKGIGLIFRNCAKWDCMAPIPMSSWLHAA